MVCGCILSKILPKYLVHLSINHENSRINRQQIFHHKHEPTYLIYDNCILLISETYTLKHLLPKEDLAYIDLSRY